ncbi:MAG: methyltransferase [Fuerstiella sp.]|nr:methyltransferase [Fuerstiella sp.]MCP4855452.1 methyltransferase [Fuerstiella sp.]
MLNKQLRVLLIAASLTGCGSGGKTESSPQTLSATVESPEQPVTTLVVSPAGKQVPSILSWESVESLPEQIAVFDHVFWEPDDTRSLREILRTTDTVHNRSVLEIGTGTGIVSLCCLQAGANKIVATDINPWAVRNAAYNAEVLNFAHQMEVRMVAQNRPLAWSVIGQKERFDVILSNPPWELGNTTRVEDFALYDPDFRLMESFVEGLPEHLNSDGRAFLAYGCVTAIRRLQTLLRNNSLPFRVLDDRSLDDLPETFLPGMLIEIRLHDDFDSP